MCLKKHVKYIISEGGVNWSEEQCSQKAGQQYNIIRQENHKYLLRNTNKQKQKQGHEIIQQKT